MGGSVSCLFMRHVNMEYLGIQESCLVSILIPLNFAVGEYVIWFKKKGYNKSRIIANVFIIVVGVIITLCLAKKHTDPYIPFIFMGGIIVAIVQNSILVIKRKETDQSYYTNKVLNI